ncbi:ABC transporter substrate-binding protein [Actinomadura madurae]|uniref:ABC transporter substrate-binding protein n=1 Tax=Actinomadura madurae TaxID=1993 RepID=UPI0020D221D4|nr:ABC transporter substrate-binding protein [Actinomadura madurae]MCP9953403.1 ABC transporter substrate-binding protein [Actinomadura madurae]MCQ0005822.1 ABC transporter substrate-binding protein [Actinomadura madurae]
MSLPPPRVGRRRPRRAVAVLLAGLLPAAGCAVANSDSLTGGADGALRIVLQQEPPTLEPCESSLTSTGIVVRSNITEPLIERDPTSGALKPLLATGWKSTDDKTWTFTLRKGVTFQDGTPFDAADVAFTVKRAVGSKLGCNVDGYVFADSRLDVAVVDDSTVRVTADRPDPILPLRMSFLEIVPTGTDDTSKVREPIGTGPYKIAEWKPGISLQLDRNPRYWGAKPAYPAVRYVWRSENSIRAAMVTSGEAGIAVGLGPEDGAGDLGVAYPNNETTALRMDAGTPPLNDIRVRRAINYAIDKKGIVKSLFLNLGEPAGQLVPRGVVGHDPSIQAWPYDPAKAKALVGEARAAGTPVDTQITLVARTAQFPKVSETAEVIQHELARAGLKVRIKMLDTAAHLEYQLKPFVTDAGPILLLIMHGNQAGDASFTTSQYMVGDGPQSRYGTPELDAKIAAADETAGAERQTAFAAVLRYQNENVVQYAHIAHMRGLLGIAPSVEYRPNSATGDELRLAEVRPAR